MTSVRAQILLTGVCIDIIVFSQRETKIKWNLRSTVQKGLHTIVVLSQWTETQWPLFVLFDNSIGREESEWALSS